MTLNTFFQHIFNQTVTTVIILFYFLLVGIFLSYRILSYVTHFLARILIRFWASHLHYNILYRRRRFVGPLTRLKALLTIIYWAANIALNFAGVSSLDGAGARAGQLAVGNCLPLILVEKLWLGADVFGVSLRSYQAVHRAFGAMTFLQTIVHFAIFINRQAVNFNNSVQSYGIACGVAIAVGALIPLFQRRAFELTFVTHRLAALGIIVSLWFHTSSKEELRPFLIAAFSSYGASLLFRVLRILFRNLPWKGRSTKAEVLRGPSKEITFLNVTLGRPWGVRGGQTVYIWLPGITFWSFLQTHPLPIYWDEVDNLDFEAPETKQRRDRIQLVVKDKGEIGRRLAGLDSKTKLTAWVDGPYGRDLNLEVYGTIVFILEGIAISAATAPILYILRKHREGLTSTQRIKVIWQIDSPEDNRWVREECTKLLELDYSKMLKFHIYDQVGLQNQSSGTRISYATESKVFIGSRMDGNGETMQDDAIEREVEKSVGRTIFLVSTTTPLRDAVRKRASKIASDRISFKEMDFQPETARSFWMSVPEYSGSKVIDSPKFRTSADEN